MTNHAVAQARATARWRPLERMLRRTDSALIGQFAAVVLVSLASAYIMWLGRPDVAVQPGAPLRTDLGGHIVALKHLVEVSLPSGHLLDWSHQWFAGYPSFYFYFPLPALVIAALSALAPLEIAAKLVAIAAPALLPPVVYFFIRSLGLGRAHAALSVIATVAFVSITSQYIFGGNVLSSVIGEYSYAIGFAFALVYLGLVARAARGHAHTVLLAVTLAATALSHLIPLIFAVAASTAVLNQKSARRPVVLSWVIGFGLSAFWTVPFVVRSPYMGHVLWLRRTPLLSLFPLPVLIVLPWFAAALAVLRKDTERLRLVLALGLVALLSYLIPHGMFAPGRALPLWHFVVYICTALGIVAGVNAAWRAERRIQLAFWAAGMVMLIGASIIQLELVRKRSFELLSSDAPDYWSYMKLQDRLSELAPGRIQWEYRRTEQEVLGARLPLGRLPATLPTMRVAQGLLVESALTSPAYTFAFASVAWDSMNNRYWRLPARNDHDDSRMRARLRQLGIDYFVTTSERGTEWARQNAQFFTPLARDSAWTVWRVRGSALVEPLGIAPRLVSRASWQSELSRWLETTADTTPWPVIADAAGQRKLNAASVGSSFGKINSALTYRTVWFSTNAIGIPHLVRVGYFPNWRAYGADGPYLAVPGFMVVIPRQHNVLLRFEPTWVERTGALITIATLAGLAMIALRRTRRPTSRSA